MELNLLITKVGGHLERLWIIVICWMQVVRDQNKLGLEEIYQYFLIEWL